ncbi:MAG: type II toxin-antitoxin system HicB family antitoxin [Oscillatoriaceae cyanobacterium Prado104]|jgi:predicted RNase H-like HicB family nuclease|nr:type II toxin-antitoxin system HicB family antitoxin [Oscillatoriaceae cyanobacterium Prado104]
MNADESEFKSLEYYLSLRYPVVFYPESKGYTAVIKELRGCTSVGETLLEAIENIEGARELWIETAFELGDEIPLPATEIECSGSLLLQIPKSLHKDLADIAEREGVSIEEFILAVLSKAV